MTTEAPKKKKRPSKKTKKDWRKNVDIADVEDYLEDKRLGERVGVNFDGDQKNELFVIDEAPNKAEEEAAEVPDDRLARKRKRAAKPLKCFEHLEIKTGAADPIKKRNRVRTQEERKNPAVAKKENERRLRGIRKAKEITAEKDRQQTKSKKAAESDTKTTRRRTKFDFDLWDAEPNGGARSATGAALQGDSWLNDNTRLHNLKSTGSLVRKVPSDFRRTVSKLAKVEAPHSGSSYNPSFADHQDLLLKAAVVEVNKDREAHKIEYHTTRMFPDAKNAPTMESYIKEMSEGIKELESKEAEDEEEPSAKEGASSGEEEEEEEKSVTDNKLKTRKMRRKEKEAKAEVAARKKKADAKKKNQDVFRVKTLKKSIVASEARTAERKARRREAREAKMSLPATLSKHKFQESEMELKLTDELTGNLRSLKPEGNLLEDRYKSLQKRNLIETRVKAKIVKNPKKRKRLEKRNYKMPWEKPDPIKA